MDVMVGVAVITVAVIYRNATDKVIRMSRQSELWKGEFGDAYHQRNTEVSRHNFWNKVLAGYRNLITSVFEPGAGKGDNLAAMKNVLYEEPRLTGMDVNESACTAMNNRGIVGIHGAFPDMPIDNKYDLVLTRGFLIHVPMATLPATLDKLYAMSNKFICVAEYYSPSHRRVCYRGDRNAMWTADYAGMLMKRHPDLKLLRYGFEYWQEDGDDITWFLMEKK